MAYPNRPVLSLGPVLGSVVDRGYTVENEIEVKEGSSPNLTVSISASSFGSDL